MDIIQKAGPFAAFTNAVVAIATLYVALVMIGPDALTDQNKFVEIAVKNPAPLYIQDMLKLIGAVCGMVLIIVLYLRLHRAATLRMNVAVVFGCLSILLLLSNAILSLMTTAQADEFAATKSESGSQLNSIIGMLAMAAIFTNGIWYLLISWTALKSSALPKGLNYLGLAIGVIFLVPMLGIIGLLLNVVWSFWFGRTLAKEISR
jgi:ABC-type siderophore export system fused ATPase/permease subunit